MDLFIVRTIHGFRLRMGYVSEWSSPWDTVVAVFPRAGHLVDDVVNALSHDDHLVIQAPISCVLEVSDADDDDDDDDDSLCPGCSCEAPPPPVLRPAREGGPAPHTKRQRTPTPPRPPRRRRARTSTPEAGR
jgi:hypothetical protein